MKYWIRPVSLTVEAKQSELAVFFEYPCLLLHFIMKHQKSHFPYFNFTIIGRLNRAFLPLCCSTPGYFSSSTQFSPPLAHTNQAVMQESMGKVGIKQRLMTSYKDACCKKGFILWIEKKLTKSFYQTRIEGFLIQK